MDTSGDQSRALVRGVAKYFPDQQSDNMALRKLIHVTKINKISRSLQSVHDL